MYEIRTYKKEYQSKLVDFLNKCMPESERVLDINGQHSMYLNTECNFLDFWCTFENKTIIGTVALKKLSEKDCELKSLYIYKKYYGCGLGYNLISEAITQAKKYGFKQMFLDTLSSSTRATKLYQKIGFVLTERYNNNNIANVFMFLNLDSYDIGNEVD